MSDDRGVGMVVVGAITCVRDDGSSEPGRQRYVLVEVGQPVSMSREMKGCSVCLQGEHYRSCEEVAASPSLGGKAV
jgi:hypothetical protein